MTEGKTAEQTEKDFEKYDNGYKETVTNAFREKARLVADLLTIKMNNLQPWYETGYVSATDTTEEVLYSRQLKVKEVLVLTNVSTEISTTVPDTLRIAIERGGEIVTLNRDVPSAADISVDWGGQVLLIEHDRLKLSAFGATANDIFKYSASGYKVRA